MNMNPRVATIFLTSLMLLIALDGMMESLRQPGPAEDISFSRLLSEVDHGHVRDVLIQGSHIRGTFADDRSFQTYAPDDSTLIERLYGKGVIIAVKPQGENGLGPYRL
jgi:cell division protease FtsH